MARAMERLTALGVSRLTKPGFYPDGGGLLLPIWQNGNQELADAVLAWRQGNLDGLGLGQDLHAC